ncbi:hypothetical protein SAMN05216405_4002 [Lachnospiraceae bacterium NLAE-zl-G231]|nr:hypothetical protein SAMN05216405_4002 [Lachnospiraceae bacterium NLAE-zl-G231]
MFKWIDIVNKINKTKKQIVFAFYCLPHGDDKRYVESVKSIGKEYNLVEIEKNHKACGESIVYHIAMLPSGAGFFADFNKLLSYLYFADKMEIIPVVEFSAESRYAEKNPVNGTRNPFEYYFQQPADISLNEMHEMKIVLKSRRENVVLANSLNDQSGGYVKTERFLKEMSVIFAKYIKYNSVTEDMLARDTQKIKGWKKTLGVHVRGTDFKRNYNGHPVLISTEEYLEKVIQIFSKGIYEQIFLATDDLNALRLFEEHFGNKIIFFENTVRAEGNESVMNSYPIRENHHYLLGYEVLRDMEMLSRCEGLVAGLSQVSYAARIAKLSRKESYIDEEILNRGINYHRRYNCPN